jgi:peptidoglycan biosynthesis protein MviN/MurJ (putative lipid II flippase)
MGATPFRVGLAAVAMNVALDAAPVRRLGAPGLVLASVGVNLFAVVLLALALERALGRIAWWGLSGDLLANTLAVAGAAGALIFLAAARLLGIRDGGRILGGRHRAEPRDGACRCRGLQPGTVRQRWSCRER